MLIWSANSWILNSYAWPTKNNIHLPTHMTEEYGSDEYFMRQALAQAQMASERGEIPVGVVITGGGCTLYVTLEPCQMCAGAMYWAQLPRLVFGASDPKRGYRSMGASLHPRTEVRSGVLENECRTLLDDFFKKLR